MQDEELTHAIIECAYHVHNVLGSGFLERVYENALAMALRKHGMRVIQQAPIQVRYEGEIVGEYYADLWVEDRVIVELKATDDIHPAHEAQLVNYLKATGVDIGLLINFSSSVQIKRKHRVYRRRQESTS